VIYGFNDDCKRKFENRVTSYWRCTVCAGMCLCVARETVDGIYQKTHTYNIFRNVIFILNKVFCQFKDIFIEIKFVFIKLHFFFIKSKHVYFVN